MLAYLAAPYSSSSKEEKEQRIKALCEKDAELMKQGIFTISPLLKHLVIQNVPDVPGDWEYWKEYSHTLLAKCDLLIVLTLPGWYESTGVQEEIKFAKEIGMEIIFM